MSIISVSKLNKSYVSEPILTDVSFHINKGDRVGIVGANGAGKSTLIKILAGEIDYDDGEIYKEKDLAIGYLRQREHFPGGGTVEQEIMKLAPKFNLPEGADPAKWALGMLKSLAFTDSALQQSVDSLSGGERTRLALSALLLENPDLLLLDEPTNHLDIGTLKWLEQYLKSYRGSIVVISHDRYFLDKIASRIFEIENCKLSCYEGNYSTYKTKKEVQYEQDLKHYENAMAERRRQEDIIRVMKGHNTEHLVKRAQSREKRLAMEELPDKPVYFNEKIRINFEQAIQSGNDVLKAQGLAFSYPDGEQLFENVDMDIKRGERICIVGPNGVGKTTLLKILLGQLPANSGRFTLGQNVIPAYYDQEQRLLNPENTVLEEIHSSYIKYDQTDLRKLLGRFTFYGDDVFKQIKDLAGGEKAKVSLLKLMMSKANLLILDEPTNHLDIKAKEVFEDALLEFPGTLIIVSHDRYLLKKIPTSIYELTPAGINIYLGNYDYYEEKSQLVGSGKAYLKELSGGGGANAAAAASKEERTQQYKQAKEEALAKRKAEKALASLEEEIAKAEARCSEIEAELCKPEVYTNAAKAAEFSQELAAVKSFIDTKYTEWYNAKT